MKSIGYLLYMYALDVVLKATPTQWWATHKEDIPTWDEVQPTMIHNFIPPLEFKC